MVRNMVRNKTVVPAAVGIIPDDDTIMVFGGKRLKAGEEYIFPDNVKTLLFVSQSGPDHQPCIGIELSKEHGELHGPCSTGTHFEVRAQIVPTQSYSLSFSRPVSGTNVVAFNLADSTPDEKLEPLYSQELVPHSIGDANKNGADLVAVRISWDDKPKDGPEDELGLDLVTYPPAVARGPNYGMIHNDEPFDGGVTVSKILSSCCIIAYVPRKHCDIIMDALSHCMTVAPTDVKRPFGIPNMDDYDRKHLERNIHLLFVKHGGVPVPLQPVTNWLHCRAANVLGMGAETLLIQQAIENLADKPCRVVCFRGNNGRFFVGVELPRVQDEELYNLSRTIFRDGQYIHVCRFEPTAWDPNSGDRRPKFEDRDPYPARVLDEPPSGINLPSSCEIVAEVYPRRVDLWLQLPDQTSQSKGFISSFRKHLDPIERNSQNHQTYADYNTYCAQEIQKKRTRSLLCGRGTRRFAFDAEHELVPPYPGKVVDLLELTGASTEDFLTVKIILNTIGELGTYSGFVQSVIQAVPDGILGIEAFPGAGKTTVVAAIDSCLCLLSKDFKILVISGQNAALDALARNLNDRLHKAVTNINKDQDRCEPILRLPLVLRASGDGKADVDELVRIIESRYEFGPDPNRPNTLCELLLQLLDAGSHRLPTFSKAELTDLADFIRSQESETFRKLRAFVAGEMTWAEANLAPVTRNSKTTANDALSDVISRILPNVNVLVCTTATATKKAYSDFVQTADLCQNEEAGATSCPQIFAGWRGVGQPLILSGDSAQFGTYTFYMQNKCVFWQHLATSTLDMIKRGGYPVFQLNTQHRAIDGQFDPVYENFYSDFRPIKSGDSQNPDKHPDAQRVEAAFVADFADLQASEAWRILPMFIHVPGSTSKKVRTSWHNPEQTKAAAYVVKKLVRCDVKPAEIMVIGAYRAEIMRLRMVMDKDVLVTTADAVQGQERSYVVFVFATTQEKGPGFTTDPRRLCVSMSRQKKFLAMVGDINTVNYSNIDLAPKDGSVHLANIHRYFVDNKRVGTYGEIQEAAQDAASVPDPLNTEIRDEEEERLQAEVDAAVAALNAHKRSKANKTASQPSMETGPSDR